jgi:signal transduction histidine kinase
MIAERATGLTTEVAKDEKRFSRSSRLVILFAIILVLASVAQKAYRFTLPTEGWSTTTDFENDEPIFVQNLLDAPSPLQAGDRLKAVEGIPYTVLEQQVLQGNTVRLENYQAGQSVRYTVSREGKELDVEVPLYPGTSFTLGAILRNLSVGDCVGGLVMWLGYSLTLYVFWKRPRHISARLFFLRHTVALVSALSWTVSPLSVADTLSPLTLYSGLFFSFFILTLLEFPLNLHLILSFPKPRPVLQKPWVLVLLYGLPWIIAAQFIVTGVMPTPLTLVIATLYHVLSLVAVIRMLFEFRTPVEQAQARWFGLGYGVLLLSLPVDILTDLGMPGTNPALFATLLNTIPYDFIYVLCVAVALLRYRLFDIDVILNRTLVYGTLSLGVVAVYSGLVTGSSYLLQTQSNITVSVIAATLILFLLKPFHQVLQQSVNRFIPATPIHYIMSTASSEFTTSGDETENFSPQPDRKEKESSRSIRLVIIFAIALMSSSVIQKAYRFTLPTDGWSTTTDFENDEPILVKNLVDAPSELQAGDRVIAVEGVSFLTLLEQGASLQQNNITYEVGQSVRYTVLRDSKELDVNVPLYSGLSIGLGNILRQLFTSNGVGDFFLWLAIFLTIFVFWKRPKNLTAQLLFLQSSATIAAAISWAVTPLSVADILNPVTLFVASFMSHWIHLTLVQPLGLHTILSFPKPNRVLQKRWTLPLLYGLPLVVCMLGITSVIPAVTAFIVVALYNLLGVIVVVWMFFTKRESVETAQVRWFTFGYALTSLGTLLFGLGAAGVIPAAVASAAEFIPFNLLYLACIAIAIFRYRLFDIDVIINRTLVYGGLTLSVISLYVLVVGGLGRLIQAQGNLTLSLFATGFIAIMFQPLRQRLQKGANRLLYGDRDDPYKVLSKLSERVEGTLEPSKLLPTMTETIAQTLKLPFAAIALGQNGDMQIVASHGIAKSESVALPLSYQGELVGELRLEPRAGETFKPSELNLLKTIAQQASVAAHTVKQHLDLQHSREALVTAREEERLRIRRDLHDGLGPELASLTLKLDATRNILKYDVHKAETLLVELKHQTQDAVASIRRLVYALRPPALDELGLEGALREQARSYEHVLNIELNTVGDLTNLPAATEVACYRIAQEALTNVVRHSRAKNCTIILCAAHQLFIDVQDDGIGLREEYRAGVGLRSMRERAEELGGTFTITSSEKGTRLLATLPLLGKE